MGCVYVATNKINGKKYVGKTIKSLKVRRQRHKKDTKRGCDCLFHKALRKYGLDAFGWAVEFESDNEKYLFKVEKELIIELRAKVPNGYNITDGGEGASGWRHSQEAREKMSKVQKGREFSQEHKNKISRANRGENNAQSKLTEKDVIKIRYLDDLGINRVVIAERYNLCLSHVWMICARKKWKYI